MTKLTGIGANVFGWAFFLMVVYLSYRFIWKDSLPNIFYKGWGTLQAQYAADQVPAQRFTTTARIGSEVYQGTLYILADAQGVYLQRTLLKPYRKALYIPYSRFKLIEPPRERSKFFAVGTYGIFEVNGVDIWLDKPYADQIIAHIAP